MQLVSDLNALRELLSDPDKWSQRHMKTTNRFGESAYSLPGAARAVLSKTMPDYFNRQVAVFDSIQRKLARDGIREDLSISRFNNECASHEDMMTFLGQLLIEAGGLRVD